MTATKHAADSVNDEIIQRMKRLEMLVRNHNNLMTWAEKVSIDCHPPGMERSQVEEPVKAALRKTAIAVVKAEQVKIRNQIKEEFEIGP